MAPEETLLRLIAERDPDAMVGFFDAHAASVRRYCEELCPERLDEATLAAMVDFVARAAAAPSDADLSELLRKATRTAAARRMDQGRARDPMCPAMPELIAARINDELLRDDEGLSKHLKHCRGCKEIAERLAQADYAWLNPSADEPPAYLRDVWLELIASPEHTAGDQSSAAETDAVEPPIEPEPEAAERATPEPSAPQPTSVRARRGGLVGVVRRLASSRRRDQ